MRSLVSLAVFALTAFTGFGQQILPTNRQPVSVFLSGSNIHVLSAQIDRNFDGIYSYAEGDGSATWTTFDRQTFVPTLETEFPWAYVVAGRIGVNAVSGRLYIGVGDSVLIYSLDNHQQLGILDTSRAFAVSASGDGQRFYLSRRPSFNAPGYVDQVTPGAPMPIRLDAGINPQMTKTYRTSDNSVGVAIVCEGVFGQANGTIEIWAPGQTGYERTTISVGDTPNYIAVDGDAAYVVVNGSHAIVKINLLTKSAVDTFATETAGYDGPREAAINDDYIFITTFAGDVRVFDKNSGQRLFTVDVDSKPEGLAIFDDKLFVTRTFQAENYNPYNGLAVYTLNQVLSVAETAAEHGATKAVFAIDATIRLPMFRGSSSLDVYNVNGNRGMITVVDYDSMSIDLSALPSGIYIITDGRKSIVVGR